MKSGNLEPVVIARVSLISALLLFAFSSLNAADEDGVFIIDQPEHSSAEMRAAAREIPSVNYLPPSNRWENLPKTVAALSGASAQLRIVMLGDSIVNDTARSRWGELLHDQYPSCRISVVAIVRGSTGCWWYKDSGRVSRYVVPLRPDLLVIGGISQRDDVDSIREVIQQVRDTRPCDVLLMTGAFGHVDPNDPKQWTFEIPSSPGNNYRARLRDLAEEMRLGFLDMTAHWGACVRSSGRPVEWFKRDAVHANIRGEQVLGQVLVRHFSPPLPAVSRHADGRSS